MAGTLFQWVSGNWVKVMDAAAVALHTHTSDDLDAQSKFTLQRSHGLKALVVEQGGGGYNAAQRCAAWGYDVTRVTSLSGIAISDVVKYDLLVGDAGYYGLDGSFKAMAAAAWAAGVSLYTTGNDTTDISPLFTTYGMRGVKNEILPFGTHQVSQNWPSYYDNDANYYLKGLHPSAIVVATTIVDGGAAEPMAVVMENPENRARWFHMETMASGSPYALVTAGLTYLTGVPNDGPTWAPTLRTLGTGPQQAVAGNDPRLSDARPPTAHGHALTDANITGVLPIAQIPTGTTGSTVALGNDSRFTDARTPTAHSHLIADLPVATSGTSNATQLVRADDSRLSNSRTPTTHSHLLADLPVATSGTSNSTQLVRADDSRLSNSRTPTTHSHAIADLPVAASGTSSTTQVVRADDSRLSDARPPTTHGHALTDANITGILPIAQVPVAASGVSSTTLVVRADDSRLSNSRTPTAHTHLIADLPVATSGTSNSTQLVRADDSRLSNSRTPTTHGHAIADLPVAPSGTSNATQVVRADDSRLSDARTPTTHTHDDRYFTETEVSAEVVALKAFSVKMNGNLTSDPYFDQIPGVAGTFSTLPGTTYASSDSVNVPQTNVPVGNVRSLPSSYDMFDRYTAGIPLRPGDSFLIDVWACHKGTDTNDLHLRVWVSSEDATSSATAGWAYPGAAVTRAEAQDVWVRKQVVVTVPENTYAGPGAGRPPKYGFPGFGTGGPTGGNGWLVANWTIFRIPRSDELPVAPSGASSSTQIVRADDSRLSDARPPTTHGHALTDANITGVLPIAQVPVAASGTSSSTLVVRADDSRLSNSRTPTAHTHPVGDLTATGTKSSATYLRGDNVWATPPDTNTTYSTASQAEAENPADTNARLYTGQRVAQAIAVHANVKRVYWTSGAAPARPAGADYVEWIGPTQPTGSVTGDTWWPTA